MRFLALLALLPALLLSAGCKDVHAPAPLAKPSFANMPAYNFAVSQIDIVDEYVAPMKSPNIEHLFPTPPAEGVKIWVNDRMKASGGTNRMEVVIKQASVVETQLPKTPGVKGAFTVEQSQRYEAKLEVEIKVYGSKKLLPEANVQVNASKSQTIAEDASLDERERVFNKLTQDLLMLMNTEMEKNINAYLNAYIAN